MDAEDTPAFNGDEFTDLDDEGPIELWGRDKAEICLSTTTELAVDGRMEEVCNSNGGGYPEPLDDLCLDCA